MDANTLSNTNLHLVWVYSGNLVEKMDAATFLVPTQVLRHSGWNVTLIAAGDPDQKLVRGVEIAHIYRQDIYLLRQIIFHLRVIKKLFKQLVGIDILFFHEVSVPLFLLFWVFLKLTGKKHPLFVMDTRTLPMESEDRATWKDRLRGTFFLQMNKLANCFFEGRTTITKRMAESLKVPPDKLWGVWHSGVDLDIFSGAVQARCFPQPGEPIHIIYIGCMHYERNLLTLSMAVTQANADEHVFTLTIVGDGNARTELEEYAANEGRHVHIFPPVPHEEVPEWLSKAHIGALPFPDEEKFRVSSPIKLFEYLAAGLPILATGIVCHTDVIETDGVAFWADGADQEGLFGALMQIKNRRDKLALMSKNAAALANAWTWQSSADKLKQALEYGIKKQKFS
jgi:glycosyltransferase involved in cell wall biosynthesis